MIFFLVSVVKTVSEKHRSHRIPMQGFTSRPLAPVVGNKMAAGLLWLNYGCVEKFQMSLF